MGAFALATAAAGAVGGIASSIIGGSSSKKSVSKTNAANLAIAQMNNEFNERMMDKQIQYNWDMWNATNDYNTASKQRARLDHAGLNGALLMSGQNAGTASSAGGVTPPTASEIGRQVPFDPSSYINQIGSTLGQFAQYAQMMQNQPLINSQVDKNQADANAVNIENSWRHQMLGAQYARMAEETNSFKLKNNFQELSNALFTESFNDQLRNYALQNYNIEADIEQKLSASALASVQTELARGELRWLDRKNAATIAELSSRAWLNNANAGLSYEQAKTEGSKRLVLDAQAKGIRINNKQANRMMDSVVSKAKYDAMTSYWQCVSSSMQPQLIKKTLRQMGSDYWNPFKYSNMSGSDLIGLISPLKFAKSIKVKGFQ